jgi:DNA polymerase I-like protein with 3'-5' exonuclease and polymerase domains
MQGGAFEIIKRAGIRYVETLPWPLVLTVHDSYVVEFPKTEYTEENLLRVKKVLEAVPESQDMGVPFDFDYKVWGE